MAAENISPSSSNDEDIKKMKKEINETKKRMNRSSSNDVEMREGINRIEKGIQEIHQELRMQPIYQIIFVLILFFFYWHSQGL